MPMRKRMSPIARRARSKRRIRPKRRKKPPVRFGVRVEEMGRVGSATYRLCRRLRRLFGCRRASM